MNTGDLKSFFYLENGDIQFSVYESRKTTKKLDPGSYKIDYDTYNHTVTVSMDKDVEKAKTHNFSDKDKIDKLFNAFFNENIHKKISDLGFCHKVGLLFYGREGSGKTTIIKSYYSDFISTRGAIVFHLTRRDYYLKSCWEFIQKVRSIQKNPIVVVMDEFDQYMAEQEAFLKTVIDGNMSINNCVFMACTNYIDKVPKAMKNRLSRFKYCINIEGIQVVEDIYSIVDNMIGDMFSDEEIMSFCFEMKGKTIDEIKHFCEDKIMNIEEYKPNKSKIGF